MKWTLKSSSRHGTRSTFLVGSHENDGVMVMRLMLMLLMMMVLIMVVILVLMPMLTLITS